jgi:hypothetical protein
MMIRSHMGSNQLGNPRVPSIRHDLPNALQGVDTMPHKDAGMTINLSCDAGIQPTNPEVTFMKPH